ncbi:pleiotropic regulatory protein RsmS [uncultured Pluralibacter sp.]|uniref:pleiotropic regulatory protein RsmS n=1 Tax=uncultured Pluralibacter sp. TaxID=1490864 RepID=UPI0026381013|nr:pleiotropic regulatory protein RsmS [uncultured Pluralibacter sp.]
MSLENAPDEVKLAVDLIMLLEEHAVAPETVLGALEIVRKDFVRKLRESGDSDPRSPAAGEREA